jgi:hypothetical protein
MGRLETLWGETCPECADWPLEIGIKIVEIVIEPGEPLPPPDPNKRHPAHFGPCPCCGRTHRAKVVAIERSGDMAE